MIFTVLVLLWCHFNDITFALALFLDFQGWHSDPKVPFSWCTKSSPENSWAQPDEADHNGWDQGTWMVPEGLCSCSSIRQRWWRFTAWSGSSSQGGICIWTTGDYLWPQDRRQLYMSVPHWSLNSGFLCFFFLQKEINPSPGDKTTHQINAFQLIGMASSLDLSGFFEEEVCKLSVGTV